MDKSDWVNCCTSRFGENDQLRSSADGPLTPRRDARIGVARVISASKDASKQQDQSASVGFQMSQAPPLEERVRDIEEKISILLKAHESRESNEKREQAWKASIEQFLKARGDEFKKMKQELEQLNGFQAGKQARHSIDMQEKEKKYEEDRSCHPEQVQIDFQALASAVNCLKTSTEKQYETLLFEFEDLRTQCKARADMEASWNDVVSQNIQIALESKSEEMRSDEFVEVEDAERIAQANVREITSSRIEVQDSQSAVAWTKQDDSEIEREIAESVWDVMLLCFVDQVGCFASAFMIMSFLIVILIQLIFVVVTRTSTFASSELLDLEDVRFWRFNIAHDYAHRNTLGPNWKTRGQDGLI